MRFVPSAHRTRRTSRRPTPSDLISNFGRRNDATQRAIRIASKVKAECLQIDDDECTGKAFVRGIIREDEVDRRITKQNEVSFRLLEPKWSALFGQKLEPVNCARLLGCESEQIVYSLWRARADRSRSRRDPAL